MGEQSEECGERAESGGEEDEEWELLLRVDRHLVERRQQLTVSALRATAKEQMFIFTAMLHGNPR